VSYGSQLRILQTELREAVCPLRFELLLGFELCSEVPGVAEGSFTWAQEQIAGRPGKPWEDEQG
jgi:hypothetical protein